MCTSPESGGGTRYTRSGVRAMHRHVRRRITRRERGTRKRPAGLRVRGQGGLVVGGSRLAPALGPAR